MSMLISVINLLDLPLRPQLLCHCYKDFFFLIIKSGDHVRLFVISVHAAGYFAVQKTAQ